MLRTLRRGLLCLWVAGSVVAREQPGPRARTRVTVSGPLLAARQRVLSAQPLGLYYLSDASRGLESLDAHAHEITLLAPQCFWVSARGTVHGALPPEVRDIAERAHLAIMPLLVNPSFDRTVATNLLHSLKAQQRATASLASLARRDHFIGFQIDLENINPHDQKLFTRFVERVAKRLHRDGRLVSVAVVPRFSDTYPGQSRSGEFSTGQWAAPYDYRSLGRAVDFLSLMTYDHHGRESPPGPIAGQPWVDEALEYAVRRITPRKILMGIPFYGRDWIESEHGSAAQSLTFPEATALLQQGAIQQQWDEHWRSPWFQYRQGPALHTVWFENSRSLCEKLALARKYRLRGFAAWRLGAEDPEFWALASTETEERGPSQPAGPERQSLSLACPGRRDQPGNAGSQTGVPIRTVLPARRPFRGERSSQ